MSTRAAIEDGLSAHRIVVPPEGHFLPPGAPSRYTTSIDQEGVLSIVPENDQRVSDPLNEKRQEPAEAALSTTLLTAADGAELSLEVTLSAPPYRRVGVEFDDDANPKITYGPGSDFTKKDGPCPQIRMPQNGGIVLTLSSRQEGARFADPPFAPPPPSDWITDVGTDGRSAFLADLHPDAGSEYAFRIRVSYGDRVQESEDPTIVNVDPSQR